jgi:hypothetical protein
MINKKIVNNSSNQKNEFINNIRNLVDVNIKAQESIPTYEGLKIKLRSIIDMAKTIYRNLTNVLPEFNSHISAGKLISVLYLKIHEMMIESKNAHMKDYIVKEKRILKIRKIALKTERNCVKCLFALYDSIQSTALLIIPNYEKIVILQNELENMYSLRPRTAIYYGEEDGNFEDPNDDDYNPSDDEDDQDDEEFDFDEDDNNSEYNPSDDEEDDDEEFDFDEDDEEDEDDDSDYDYEDEDEYSTEDADFMNEYNNDPEYLLDEDDDDEEEFDFDEDDNDSEYTPSETDEDDNYSEFDFDEDDDNDSEYTPSEADEDEEEFDFDEEDDNDSDYNPDEDADDTDEEFEFDEDEDDDDEEDYDYEDQDEYDTEDREFISNYLNDPDYDPNEDEDEEDDLEYDYNFLNKKVDDNDNIVLKAGIADDNDEEDPDYDPTEDEDEDEDEDDIKYVNNKNILNICKRRFENGKVVYRWVKMTKEQAEKKYDEDYVCEDN